MKNLLKDKNGNANVILLGIMTCIMGFGMLTIGSYLYFSIAQSADAGQIVLDPARAASGSVAFSGINVTNAEGFRITYGTGIYYFEFNTTTPSPSVCANVNCIIVNVYNTNNSLNAATNLTAAINTNATVAALVTATNPANRTNLVADTAGTGGNSIGTVGFIGGATISGLTLTGGYNAVTGQDSQTALNNYVVIVFPLFGLALLVLGFSVILITLRGSFGKGDGR